MCSWRERDEIRGFQAVAGFSVRKGEIHATASGSRGTSASSPSSSMRLFFPDGVTPHHKRASLRQELSSGDEAELQTLLRAFSGIPQWDS